MIVATDSFSVDDPANELVVMEAAEELGVPATGGHEISKLYGLTIRTRTAVINASILPKMLETANMTEASVRKAGIEAPLMIMRGDGGVMDISRDAQAAHPDHALRPLGHAWRAPSCTCGSPTASSSRSAAPAPTSASSATAGRPSSRPRSAATGPTSTPSTSACSASPAAAWSGCKGKEIVDVGPRSAHIAGLPYAAFADDRGDRGARRLVFVQPKPEDPADYVAVGVEERHAGTPSPTPAPPTPWAWSSPSATPTATPRRPGAPSPPWPSYLGVSIDETARRILDVATDKVIPVINSLIAEYELDRDQVVLVGGGGGAAALIPHTAERMRLRVPDSRRTRRSCPPSAWRWPWCATSWSG